MQRRHALALLTAALVPRPARAAGGPPHSFTAPLMGTRFILQIHHPDPAHARAAAERAFAAAAAIDTVASDYRADSELLSLGKAAAGTPTRVSPLLFRLLAEARELAALTDGWFDPTLGPLTVLWREARRRHRLPDPATLAAARAACGWSALLLDPGRLEVTLERPGMRLDLGGIAKGQAAEAIHTSLRADGLARTCVTAGGDVRLGDPPPDAAGWSVAVRTTAGKPTGAPLVLANAAVSTSGDLHQAIEIDGVSYAHLIDPATGLGLTRHVAATVVAATATRSDALATACCVAPAGEARRHARAWGASELRLDP